MFFADALTLDAPRRTNDGYLAVRARASRTGVYKYTGREVDPNNEHGLRDQAIVNVLRDEATVFDEAAARSFIGKPVTDNHPSEAVTASNWRDHARGTIMGALRDGDYLAFDLLLTDAATIAKVDGGKRELSNGYGAELEYGSFTAKDGTVCQARQAKITGGNHVALVDRGRAGSECAIKDGFALCDAMTADELSRLSATLTKTEKPVKTMMIDGLTVDLGNADTAIATVTTLRDARDGLKVKLTDAEGQVATLTTTLSTKDAEIATLKQQLADAALTPAQLRDAAKAYSIVCDKAKALGVQFAEDADEATVKRAVVDAKLKDAAKGWSDEQVAISFATLTADVKPAAVQPLGQPKVTTTDAASVQSARSQWLADKQAAYRGQNA